MFKANEYHTGDEFSCASGVCIPTTRRCNNINDCEDKSDEAHCTRVAMDKGYQKSFVPPPLELNVSAQSLEEQNKADINVSFSISNLMDIK